MESTKYIGMDVHQETISIAVMNAAGKLVGVPVIKCWLDRCKDIGNNRLQSNLPSPILVKFKIASKCLSNKELRASHQQLIAEPPKNGLGLRREIREIGATHER
jgi:hypothetical protein